jgi:hypothetical protein
LTKHSWTSSRSSSAPPYAPFLPKLTHYPHPLHPQAPRVYLHPLRRLPLFQPGLVAALPLRRLNHALPGRLCDIAQMGDDALAGGGEIVVPSGRRLQVS